jgi:tetratricopeptide (TPR) repeat protein/uncharacterized membrane protein YhaH (DUF805 family)
METTALTTDKFFRKSDWIACWATFAISLIVYTLTLQPTLGLEDSGELVVASDYLGVPHPPGYPIWSLLTWFFQWIFHGVKFHGHPNPAWGVNFFSAFAGAAACGALALLISRSGMDLLRSLKKESVMLGESTESLFCAVAGIAGGLLLAFGQGMWSQAVIAEVYTFNIFFQSLVLVFLYRWMSRPEQSKWLLLCAFAFGLGITNHQTLMFMGLAMAAAVLFNDLEVFQKKNAWGLVTAVVGLVILFFAVYFVNIFFQVIGIAVCVAGYLFIRTPHLVKDFFIAGVLILTVILAEMYMSMRAGQISELIQEVTTAAERNMLLLEQQILTASLWKNGPSHAGFWLFFIQLFAIPVLLAINPKRKTIAITWATLALLFVGIDQHANKQMNRYRAEKERITQSSDPAQPNYENGNAHHLRIASMNVTVGGETKTISGFNNPNFTRTIFFLALVPFLLALRLPKGKLVCATFLVMFIGLGFYLYMPISSDQNPPINWGYPRTWQGFMHAITRGQYERVKLAHVFTPRFLEQVETYLTDLRSQFYWPIAILAAIPLALFPVMRQLPQFRWRQAGRIGRFEFFNWKITWTLTLSLILIKILDTDAPIIQSCLAVTAIALLLPTAKRLQDIGHPPVWALYTLIPSALYIGIIQLIPTYPRFSKYTFLCAAALEAAMALYLLIRKGAETDNGNGGNPLTDQPAISSQNSGWIMTTLIAFLSVGIIFMILQNPKTDIQSLFIGRVQYIQSHAIFVIWLGYGILMLMATLETLARNNPITKIGGVILVLLLPFSLIHKNKTNDAQIKVVGGAEQNGHDFGWQFGNWQLEGIKGIKEDMRYWYPDDEEFEKQWAAYPCKNYPLPMGTNAIFFGGTDPGRFVPTYMIYSAHVRPDVYLITQNALADNTYMNVMRDLYGDQIWIPSPLDSNQAFQLYIQGVQNGTIQAGADVTTEDGKVQVQGVAGVMQINGFLSKMIFDHNQYRTETKTDEATRPVGSAVVYNDPTVGKDGKPPQRSFYVEESYVLPWMYPYLTPHGLIMKINNKPTQLTPEMIKNDTDFWNWYCDRLLNDEKFIRDIVARKSFSKLRSALAGLYAARGRVKESEAAFRQAVALYDLSPEANFRLADLIAKQGRFDEAIALFDDFLEKDPNNDKGAEFRNGLKKMKEMTARRQELERKIQADFKANTFVFGEVRDLILIQFSSGMAHSGETLARQIIASNKLKPEELMALAQFMAEKQKYQTVELALKQYTVIQPKDPNGWLNLAGLQMVLGKRGEMYVSIKKAVDIGGETVRNRIRSDRRFDPVRNTDEFKKLVPPQTNTNMGFSPLPGF